MARASQVRKPGGLTALALVVLLPSCAGSAPQAPSATADSNGVTGVVWFDDGDGVIASSERAADSVTVRLGIGTQTFQPPTAVATDERGGFVHQAPDLGQDPTGGLDTFVEVTLQVDGPGEASIDMRFRQAADLALSPIEVPLPSPARCDEPLDLVLDDAELCGQVMLPDLVPLVEDFDQPQTQPIATTSAYVDLVTQPGVPLLRFASATANLGAGPLHMIPSTNPNGDRLPTWQRIWTDEHLFVDQPTGEFIFHDGHDHFHLSGFEQYRLLTLEGTVVAVSEKISFCLIDSLRAVPNPRTRGLGAFLDAVCADASDQQELNPGWADYYGAGIADQWIEIAGVAAGDYLVEIVVDPDNILLEFDETNNRATFPITITKSDLSPP